MKNIYTHLFYYLGSRIYLLSCTSDVDFSIDFRNMTLSIHTYQLVSESNYIENPDIFEWVSHEFPVSYFRAYNNHNLTVRFANRAIQRDFVDFINKYHFMFLPTNPDNCELL